MRRLTDAADRLFGNWRLLFPKRPHHSVTSVWTNATLTVKPFSCLNIHLLCLSIKMSIEITWRPCLSCLRYYVKRLLENSEMVSHSVLCVITCWLKWPIWSIATIHRVDSTNLITFTSKSNPAGFNMMYSKARIQNVNPAGLNMMWIRLVFRTWQTARSSLIGV